MASQLRISVGQHTDKGRKAINQDFHGVYLPEEPQLTAKGLAIALADGISSSNVSQIASEATVAGFFEDYFCTPETWSVKQSAQRVLMATNSWLYSQTRQSQYRYDKDKGYVCTLSAMILKSTTAHLFHVGDSRIYQRHGRSLEQLTEDHRLWVSRDKSYLSRALGIDQHVEIDYRTLPMARGDTFLLMTDGVYEHADASFITATLDAYRNDLDSAARIIVEEAYRQGSTDNLTLQIIRIDELPDQEASEIAQQINELPLPPVLEARQEFDGFTIIREVHASHRSHVYLATHNETRTPVIIKTPSIDLQDDPAYLERFLLEDWIARRINSAHVLKPCLPNHRRHYLYIVTEFIDGQTLTQWMIDHPAPDLETVRGIVEQLAKGLRAFHRLEMVHQDLRPDNIMIDATGTVKIIDFGSTQVAGVRETNASDAHPHMLGTVQYSAPEYFLGERGSPRSDMFSLGVITYQMLTGKLPYGTQVAKSRTRAAQTKLHYDPVFDGKHDVPPWIDDVLRKAVHPNPHKRYPALSEFTFDLRHPNKAFLNKARPPLMERNPVLFWKSVCLILGLVIAILLAR